MAVQLPRREFDVGILMGGGQPDMGDTLDVALWDAGGHEPIGVGLSAKRIPPGCIVSMSLGAGMYCVRWVAYACTQM